VGQSLDSILVVAFMILKFVPHLSTDLRIQDQIIFTRLAFYIMWFDCTLQSFTDESISILIFFISSLIDAFVFIDPGQRNHVIHHHTLHTETKGVWFQRGPVGDFITLTNRHKGSSQRQNRPNYLMWAIRGRVLLSRWGGVAHIDSGVHAHIDSHCRVFLSLESNVITSGYSIDTKFLEPRTIFKFFVYIMFCFLQSREQFFSHNPRTSILLRRITDDKIFRFKVHFHTLHTETKGNGFKRGPGGGLYYPNQHDIKRVQPEAKAAELFIVGH